TAGLEFAARLELAMRALATRLELAARRTGLIAARRRTGVPLGAPVMVSGAVAVCTGRTEIAVARGARGPPLMAAPSAVAGRPGRARRHTGGACAWAQGRQSFRA